MKAKIREHDGIKYVLGSETEDPKAFKEWLFGATIPVIPDLDYDEDFAAYSWDYQKWLSLDKGKKPDLNWD